MYLCLYCVLVDDSFKVAMVLLQSILGSQCDWMKKNKYLSGYKEPLRAMQGPKHRSEYQGHTKNVSLVFLVCQQETMQSHSIDCIFFNLNLFLKLIFLFVFADDVCCPPVMLSWFGCTGRQGLQVIDFTLFAFIWFVLFLLLSKKLFYCYNVLMMMMFIVHLSC